MLYLLDVLGDELDAGCYTQKVVGERTAYIGHIAHGVSPTLIIIIRQGKF